MFVVSLIVDMMKTCIAQRTHNGFKQLNQRMCAAARVAPLHLALFGRLDFAFNGPSRHPYIAACTCSYGLCSDLHAIQTLPDHV